MNRLVLLPVIVVLVLFGGSVIWARAYLDRPLNLPADTVVLDIVKGSSLKAVARQLADDGVLQYPRAFELFGRLSRKAERIQAGEYELTTGVTPASLLDQLVNGRVKLHALTVVEGWTVSDLLAAIVRHTAIRHTLDIDTATELVDVLELDYAHPEGLFFPETYWFARGTTDKELLLRAYDLMQDRLAEAWANRQVRQTGLKSPYEALIMASIVERESALDSERREVAGVFVRRLEKGMRLQTDPTVIYGIGPSFDGNLTRRHLAEDTPYNTYMRKGLPPTPIALPSQSALSAAVSPLPGDSLYFVATGREDGSHYFTATLEEHNEAVRRYLAYLRQARRKERKE